MLTRVFAAISIAFGLVHGAFAADTPDLGSLERLEGFVDLYWDEDTGRVLIDIENLDDPFIYQSSLARGVGSNDLGLDRGQLGSTKIVRFIQSGPKILLLEDNLGYRAVSDNVDEQRAVEESFARSVIWGFEDIDPADSRIVVDATSFFVRDAHGLAASLLRRGEGSYSVDAAGSFTVHMHHSFIRLPDDDYEPMAYDPRSGIIGLGYGQDGYIDYATAIGDDLTVDLGRRHRLQKKDPTAALSEAVEPIVYYLDRGAPEPVRSALLDGARWWNQAFEAAGYKDAFQVRMMPEGADPMDVRYNIIQWIHRSTRGWSYGFPILDPRSGEILKGHVSLGSLRVRQDYLIAEGLLAPYDGEDIPTEMLEMSLARIRQLSAHEVGHTLGFEHNFAASAQDRSSVMDYPVPLIKVRDDNSFDLSGAYDDKIGAWDKRTVLYAYQDFPEGIDADKARRAIMDETIAAGFKYVAGGDSRSAATAHPDGNLWDNGADAIEELEHLLRVRDIALNNFSERNIRIGRPLASIEEALVPIYLLHRFQIQAVGKLIGGQYFNYNLRGDGQNTAVPVDPARQQQAIDALIATLDPKTLQLSDELLALIPPRPPGNAKSRETFSGASGTVFDPKSPAASAVAMTLAVLLEPSRAARLTQTATPGLGAVVQALLGASWYAGQAPGTTGSIQRQTNMQVLYALLGLSLDSRADADVRAMALNGVNSLNTWLAKQRPKSDVLNAHYRFAEYEIERLQRDPSAIERLTPITVPPGSPIGSFQDSFH
jgi:hypothetical protein